MNHLPNPYRAAGTFSGTAYTERQADRDLLLAIGRNQRFPYVLAPWQSGKSSLLVHVRAQLSLLKFKTAFVDLQVFAPDEITDFDHFQRRFFNECRRSLGITSPMPACEKFLDRIDQLLANSAEARLVIFVDEVNILLPSPFKEAFFGTLRNAFNERATRPDLKQVQFVLAGAARPEELISDRLRSPFNVGEAIVLNELSLEETALTCAPMASQLRIPPEKLAGAVFAQAAGSVYLTQLILEKLWESSTEEENDGPAGMTWEEKVLMIAGKIVASAPHDVHFENIQGALYRRKAALRVYHRLLLRRQATASERELLWFAGLAPRQGPAIYRNRIYQQVFQAGGPIDLVTPWRRRRQAKQLGGALFIVIVAVLLPLWPWYQRQRAVQSLAAAGFAWNENKGELVLVNSTRASLDDVSPALHKLQPGSLILRSCANLANINGLQGLTSLQELDILECGALQNEDGLTGLTSLIKLELPNSRVLQNQQVLKNLKSLVDLRLSNCGTLRELDGLKNLQSLRVLCLWDCKALQNLDGLRNLNSLETLSLSNCGMLRSSDALKSLLALRELTLSNCDTTQILKGLKGHPSLNDLIFSNCDTLRDLDGLDGLSSLQGLHINACVNLENVDGLKACPLLSFLSISQCSRRNVVWFKDLTSIRSISLSECDVLQSLDSLDGLITLESLALERCNGLRNLSGLARLSSLETLTVMSCDNLENVDGLKGLSSLKEITLQDCPNLANVDDIAGLASVQKVYVLECKNLRRVDGLAGLTSLRGLVLQNAPILQDVNVIAGLTALEQISIVGSDVREVPNFEALRSLKKVILVTRTPISREKQDELRRAYPKVRFDFGN